MISLSIITICYNIKDTIQRTCESIIAQSYKDYEWIVIDGGSTNGTQEILLKYKDKINVFISEPDTGIYNAMNKGIRLSKGKYLSFMNGGDSYCHHNVLREVFENASYREGVLYGKAYLVSNEMKKPDSEKPDPITLDFFKAGKTLNHQATFIKKELFEKFGYYNEEYKFKADTEKWIIFLKNKVEFKKIDMFIADFYMDGVSQTKEADMERAKMLKKYFNIRQQSITKYHFCGIPFLEIKSQ